jgi:L-2-hydroxyglutarate oxidase LhgO
MNAIRKVPANITGSDYIIIGGGIVGLTIAHRLKSLKPTLSVAILEKESAIAEHASGRNSGVLHAGFYYSSDSLKARFTVQGNRSLHNFCDEYKLRINRCGKLVVASTPQEVAGLEELKRRGDDNGVDLQWVTIPEMEKIEPNARTVERALYSPTTSTVDPKEICNTLAHQLAAMGVRILYGTRYVSVDARRNRIITQNGELEFGYLINCAGLHADRVARDFGYARDMTILPFKGLYLKYDGTQPPVRTNIYPVPNLANPFLGVHFTVTVDNTVKIGPTAVPALWRENYRGVSRFNLRELIEIGLLESRLFLKNAFNFRRLACDELKKYNNRHFRNLAARLVKQFDGDGFTHWSKPGIRSQLLDLKTDKLVQDFVTEGDRRSFHVLNAVSPAFTCSFPMAEFVVNKIFQLCSTGQKSVN